MLIDPGSTLATAYNLGDITIAYPASRAGSFFRNSLGTTDRIDYYKFQASFQSSVTFALDSLRSDADLRLQDSTGKTIAISDNPGNTTEFLNVTFENSGTYYLRVESDGGETNYDLNIGGSYGGPNGIFGVPRTVDLGTFSGDRTQWSAGLTGGFGAYNRYKFQLNETSNLNLSALGTDRLRLLNGTGQLIAMSSGYYTAQDTVFGNVTYSFDEGSTLSRVLNAGTYYIEVNGTGARFHMDDPLAIGVSATEIRNPTPLMSAEFTAGDLTNSSIFSRTDSVNNNDTSDIYKFTLTSARKLNVALLGLTGNADIRLFRNVNLNGVIESNEVVFTSRRSGNADESLNLASLEAGTYYLQVYQVSGNANYKVLIATNPSTPGLASRSNLLPIEVSIGTLPASYKHSGFISDKNTIDTYKFNLNGTKTIQAKLESTSKALSLRIIKDVNHNGIVDSSDVSHQLAGGLTLNLTRTLTAGSYFVVIDQYQSGFTDYDLSLKIQNSAQIPPRNPPYYLECLRNSKSNWLFPSVSALA